MGQMLVLLPFSPLASRRAVGRMGQGTSSDQQQPSSDAPSNPLVPKRFSQTLPSGLSVEAKKMLYEKEIARLLEGPPAGGQEKFRAEAKGSEKNEISEQLPNYKELIWEGQQQLYDVHKDGQVQRTFKKQTRSKADAWRKHGALTKLHEVGGNAYSGAPGPKAKYHDVKPGSAPPLTPATKPLSTVDDYRPFGSLND